MTDTRRGNARRPHPPVPKGGYYDRYQMHADLDEVAQDPAVTSVDFFRSCLVVRVHARRP